MKHSVINSKTLLAKAKYMHAMEQHHLLLTGRIFFMLSFFLLFFFASKSQQLDGHSFNNVNEKKSNNLNIGKITVIKI